jgi:glutamine synthetase
MSVEKIQQLIKDENVRFIDLRFADMRGVDQHVTFPASVANEELFEEGKMFDGSSIAGWKGINESDMVLMPDASSYFIDPFMDDKTLVIRCDVLEPATMQPYSRCPRGIAKRAEAFLRQSGIADSAFFGPEPEFFIFDSVRSEVSMKGAHFEIESREAAWSSGNKYEDGNTGHRPGIKGGYFPLPPVDSLQDIRSAMCLTLEALGLAVEVHHHEVATAGQCEIGVRFNTLVKKADELAILKYVVKSVAHQNGMTATFMPKPIVGDNGSGMHVHQSLAKGGKNLFSGDEYGGLSKTALHYIGGIFKHARAINALTNSTTNSYKRLVPGFEAPILLAYSARNRSASCRIPWVTNPKARRIEVRFPDAMNSGYLTFAALLMAGLDGIKNQIDPGAPAEKDLYDLPPEEEKAIPTVAHGLDVALDALDKDRDFLKAGGVFTDDFIDGYIDLKMKEVTALRMHTHPIEFVQYYSM